MSHHTLTLDIPERLYARLAERTWLSRRWHRRSPPRTISHPRSHARCTIRRRFDDTQLRRAAARALPERDERRLRALVRRNSAGEITPVEAAELAVFLDRLEDIGLIRAKATALLRARDHEVSDLLPNE